MGSMKKTVPHRMAKVHQIKLNKLLLVLASVSLQYKPRIGNVCTIFKPHKYALLSVWIVQMEKISVLCHAHIFNSLSFISDHYTLHKTIIELSAFITKAKHRNFSSVFLVSFTRPKGIFIFGFFVHTKSTIISLD